MCYNGIVYARTVKGRTLNFAVSGMLWQMSLVMIDKETRSLWSHLLGESMRGPLVGASLETLPSVITDWNSWKTSYPATTAVVMSRTAMEYTRNPEFVVASEMLIGIAEGKQSRAWRLSDLEQTPVANDTFAGKSVVIVFDEPTGTTILHGRSLDGRDLTFELKQGKLTDQETGSEWDLISGIAIAGPLKGRQLNRMSGIISADFAWDTFHPNSTYWKPASEAIQRQTADK